MYQNFKVSHSSLALKEKLWACARVTTKAQFKSEMISLRSMDDKVSKWVEKIPQKHWTISYQSGIEKCDMLLNNFCQSSNAAIISAREKSIITILEKIRMYIMNEMYFKRQLGNGGITLGLEL